MSSKQAERDEFVIRLTKELPDVPAHQVGELARKLLRLSATLNRLAVATSNGEWPSDNGVRPVDECQACEGLWVPSVLKGAKMIDKVTGKVRKVRACPDCRAEGKVRALLAPYGIVPQFQGDPRGYVLRLRMPSGQTNTWAGDGVGVPA